MNIYQFVAIGLHALRAMLPNHALKSNPAVRVMEAAINPEIQVDNACNRYSPRDGTIEKFRRIWYSRKEGCNASFLSIRGDQFHEIPIWEKYF